MSGKRALLWIGWLMSFAIALGAIALFVQGVLRDTRAGEPRLPVDFASPSDWRTATFRLWGAGRHRLFVSSVNHDPGHVGSPLQAEFEVALVDPDGRTVFQRAYAGGASGLALPQNYGDARLAEFSLDDRPWRSWALRARVLKPDARFATARSEIKLYKERYDPGMGGMINYVMIFPAGLFLAIAFVMAVLLRRRGSKLPLFLTAACGVALLAALSLR